MLYLIPTFIGEDSEIENMPEATIRIARKLRYFIVENLRSSRRFLRKIDPKFPIDQSEFLQINKHEISENPHQYCAALLSGKDVGLLSEAGVPAVADPGSQIVSFAHSHLIKVVPLVGPSSILLGLMASGLNGQRFAFHGYLPVQFALLHRTIKSLEQESINHQQTQILIETPYRNTTTFNALLKSLSPETQLCVAMGINTSEEFICTQSITAWRNSNPFYKKTVPALFLFLKYKEL